MLNVFTWIIEKATSILKTGASAVLPATQIEAVGGRRVWLCLVGMVFVVAGHYIGIPESLQYACLGLAGAFVVGQSAVDYKRE